MSVCDCKCLGKYLFQGLISNLICNSEFLHLQKSLQEIASSLQTKSMETESESAPRQKAPPKPKSKRIFVGGISDAISLQQLMEHFSKFDNLTEVCVYYCVFYSCSKAENILSDFLVLLFV